MVDPLSYFSFQPVLNNWCSKGLWDGEYKGSLAADKNKIVNVVMVPGSSVTI